MKKIFALLIVLSPATALAAPISDINSVSEKAKYLGDLVIELAIGVAIVWLIVNIVRYFIAGGEEERKKGGEAILYGVIGLFLIFSIWGLVHILLGTFTFEKNNRPSIENIKIGKPSGSSNTRTGPDGNPIIPGVNGSF